MRTKSSFWVATLLFLLLPVGAVTFENGTTLIATGVNATITCSDQVNASELLIEPGFVYLDNVTFIIAGTVHTCPSINHSTPDTVLDSSDFSCTADEEETETTRGGRRGGGCDSGYDLVDGRCVKIVSQGDAGDGENVTESGSGQNMTVREPTAMEEEPSAVEGIVTETRSEAAKSCFIIAGLCWYWWLLIIAGAAIAYWLWRTKDKKKD